MFRSISVYEGRLSLHDWTFNFKKLFGMPFKAFILYCGKKVMGYPGGAGGKDSPCQCRKHKWCRFDSLGQEDPLEEGMATHSSILAWRFPMDRGAWYTTVHKVTKSRTQLKYLGTHI